MPDRIPTSYIEATAQVRSTREQVLHASAAETADGNSATINVGNYAEGLLDIDISAVSGTTPSATFKLQTKINGQWRDVPGVTIAAQTATGSVTIDVTNFGEEVRLAWALTGTTPSFTFSSSFLGKS